MYEKETLADLMAVRELISDHSHWIQGDMALGPGGVGVDATDPAACCFCLVGAMYKVTRRETRSGNGNARYYRLRDAFSFKDSLSRFNDRSRHDEVLAMIDTDLEALRQKVAV